MSLPLLSTAETPSSHGTATVGTWEGGGTKKDVYLHRHEQTLHAQIGDS